MKAADRLRSGSGASANGDRRMHSACLAQAMHGEGSSKARGGGQELPV